MKHLFSILLGLMLLASGLSFASTKEPQRRITPASIESMKAQISARLKKEAEAEKAEAQRRDQAERFSEARRNVGKEKISLFLAEVEAFKKEKQKLRRRKKAADQTQKLSLEPLALAFQKARTDISDVLVHLTKKPAQTKADIKALLGIDPRNCPERIAFDSAKNKLREFLSLAFGENSLSSLDESPREEIPPSKVYLATIAKSTLGKEEFDLEGLKEKFKQATASLEEVKKIFATDERAFTQTCEGQFITDEDGNKYFRPGLCDKDAQIRALRFFELSEDIKAYFMYMNAFYHLVEEQKQFVLN